MAAAEEEGAGGRRTRTALLLLPLPLVWVGLKFALAALRLSCECIDKIERKLQMPPPLEAEAAVEAVGSADASESGAPRPCARCHCTHSAPLGSA